MKLGLIKGIKGLLLGENILKEYPSCIDKFEHLTVLQLSNNRIPPYQSGDQSQCIAYNAMYRRK